MGCVTRGAKEISLAQRDYQRQQDEQRRRDAQFREQNKISLERTFNTWHGKPAPNFIGYQNGNVFGVPQNSWGPFPTRNNDGRMFIGGQGGNGLHASVPNMRWMEPTSNHEARVVYFRERQTVNPITGRTVSRDDPAAHLNPFTKNNI